MDINLEEKEQVRSIQNYYKLQSRIYDMTRWSFLFGRKSLIHRLPIKNEDIVHIAEVGCGTGKNLSSICRHYPSSIMTGIDVSEAMINRAQKRVDRWDERVNLLHTPYTKGKNLFPTKLDGILFSYSLSMINPQWKELVDQAWSDLKVGGFIAVVDFHDTPKSWFKKHMSHHHVRMDGHILPYLEERFAPHHTCVEKVYAHTWEYFQFIGMKT